MTGLDAYRDKRDFRRTPEPRGREPAASPGRLQFVVQKHAARRLHYDFRLEHDGVLKSWAVPKGPSLDPRQRRLAVQTEDHPLEYAAFEGVIPAHEYGGGTVLVWDRGAWIPGGDVDRGLREGKLDFELHGDKLRGRWTLVRLRDERNWLLIKRRDAQAREPAAADIVEARPESVLTGRELDAVADAGDRVWHSGDGGGEAEPARVHRVGQPDTVDGARRGELPAQPAPQLATLVDTVPDGAGWFHEPKLDGYRVLCRIDRGTVALLTRRGNDWTDRFPAIAEAVRALPCTTALLDGEAAVFDPRGLTDFQALQNAIGRGGRGGRGDPSIAYVAFDLLHLDGWDLRGAPLRARKELLRLLVAGSPAALRYGDHMEGRGAEFFREACRAGLEGIVSKRADGTYEGKRTRAWLKVKCQQRQELVIVGFTEPRRSRVGLGALLLGTRDRPDGPLRYAGKVGTGFSDQLLRELRGRLEALERDTPAVANPPRGVIHWVDPELVAEIAFGEWTQDGVVRHATFRGLREDKPAAEVATERPAAGDEAVRIAGVKLTHPDKVLYPDQGLTKLDLARYYERVAELALPHLRGRPLTLLRCPEGRHHTCFYQKHAGASVPDVVPRVIVREGEEPYAMVEELPSLIALVQLGVLELHVWGARADRLEQPDLLVLDLDPADDVPWRRVVDAAVELRDRLDQLELAAFARVTGGKGLHVVVPIVPGPGWADAKRLSQAIAQSMVRDHPDQFTAKMSKHRRPGKIFLDYLRNAREATAVASYSPRARPGAPVALPVAWDELDRDADAPPRYGVADVPALLRRRARDPWASFDDARRPITGLIESRR